MDVVKVDAIAEKYAEQIEIAAAPCKNKTEELKYQLEQSERQNLQSAFEIKELRGVIVTRTNYDLTRSKFGKIWDLLWE